MVTDSPNPTVCSPTSLGKVCRPHPLQPGSEVLWSKPHHMGTGTSKAVWGAVGEAGWAGQHPQDLVPSVLAFISSCSWSH